MLKARDDGAGVAGVIFAFTCLPERIQLVFGGLPKWIVLDRCGNLFGHRFALGRDGEQSRSRLKPLPIVRERCVLDL